LETINKALTAVPFKPTGSEAQLGGGGRARALP